MSFSDPDRASIHRSPAVAAEQHTIQAGDGDTTIGKTRPPSIDLLTGLRFFLAIYVVITHFSVPPFQSTPLLLFSFLSTGFTAVSMFYALSGYVLAYNHMDGNPLDLRRFWTARAARLLPAFIVSELVLLTLNPFHMHALHQPMSDIFHSELCDVLISFSFLQAWMVGPILNSPAWSISCEVFFYLVFPFFVLPFASLSRTALRKLALALAAISLVIPVAFLATTHVPLHQLTEQALVFPTTDKALTDLRISLSEWHGIYSFLLYLPIMHLPIFLLGAAFGRYRRAFLHHASSRPERHRVAFALASASLVATLCFSAYLPHILLHDSLIGIIFCFCMLFAESAPIALRRLLKNRFMLRLGEASYALYILQIPFSYVWSILGKYILHHPVDKSRPGTPLFLLLLVLTSLAVYEWIERPTRLRIRKLAYGVVPVA